MKYDKDTLPKARWWAKLYADLMRYFWLPCPLCGQYFSGREARLNDYASIPGEGGQPGYVVCPRMSCSAEARRRTRARIWPYAPTPLELKALEPTTEFDKRFYW